MEANIIFENVKVYNVVKFDVRLNENFKIELENTGGDLRWFANNDDVLAIKVGTDSLSAQLKATSKGLSEIQIQNNQNQIQKTLFIEVYDQIAVSLNLQPGKAELK